MKFIVFLIVLRGIGCVRNMFIVVYIKDMLDEVIVVYEKVGKEMKLI